MEPCPRRAQTCLWRATPPNDPVLLKIITPTIIFFLTPSTSMVSLLMATTRTAFLMTQTQSDVAGQVGSSLLATRTPKKRIHKMSEETKVEVPQINRTVFDLDSFEDVYLLKEVPFTPATSVEEALKRLGGDSAKLLEAVNDGLLADAKRVAAHDTSIPWMQDVETEDGKTVREQFSGTIADSKVVNGMVLNLAKSVYGYNKAAAAKDKAGKTKAKEQAMAFIAGNEVIKNGLKENALPE